jgi:hypothetical protein
MIACRLRARRGVAVLLLSSAFLAPSAAHAAPAVPGMPDVIAEGGFGDPQNTYAWAMGWFKGKLYVGTGRNNWCVENAVTQFYFKFESFYTTQPAVGVHCAADPYDLDLRAEIWQYTPQTGRWRRVYRAPADIPNPRERGKFLSRDIAYRGMTVMRDRHGREALFISGVTANEYVPEIARRHPPRLLRTYDGKRFHDISRPLVVRRTGGFPDRRPIGYRGLEVWRKQLYVVASTALTGDGAVFKVRNPFDRRAQFSQVTPTGMHVFELQRFDGDLYVGTGSYDHGYAVYKTTRTRAPFRFEPVVTNGAGMGGEMVSVVSMHPFRGHLYVAGVSWYSWDRGLPATELIRIGHRGRWELVAGDPRPDQRPGPRLRELLQHAHMAHGRQGRRHLCRDARLVVATAGEREVGARVVVADRKRAFARVRLRPLGELRRHRLVRGDQDRIQPRPPLRLRRPDPRGRHTGVLHRQRQPRVRHADLGLQTVGLRVVRQSASRARCPGATIPPHRRTARRHRGVVGAHRRRGEIPSRARRVRRRAAPQPAPPGAPGSVALQVPVRKPFTVLGTTNQPYFVDRTRRQGTRYAYHVVAETARGGASPPSNVQVVPDPRPPATFRQLEDAGLPSGAVAAIARAHRPRGGPSLARLARLARTAKDDQLRQLAYRLERRLRYQNLAGGPADGG